MKVVDLTWRLPGPLATYFLAKQGVDVVKYEDVNHRDPFLKWTWDPSFADIYHAFMGPKELRLVDFSSEGDVAAIHAEIQGADAVVMSLPARVEEKLRLTPEDIVRSFTGVAFVRLGFRPGDDHSAHDLNSLAQTGLLKMHILDRTEPIIAPPFLPVTGMFYSYHIAITILATAMEQKSAAMPLQRWSYLAEAVEEARDAYYPSSIQSRAPATFLHNGRFPCYNIYRTKDGGYLAVAAVEPKFWSRFRDLTGLTDLRDEDGLAPEPRATEVKEIILRAISVRTTDDWRKIFSGEDTCVDLVGPFQQADG